jgi:hypothetical protein
MYLSAGLNLEPGALAVPPEVSQINLRIGGAADLSAKGKPPESAAKRESESSSTRYSASVSVV